jgi:hypothetical protein
MTDFMIGPPFTAKKLRGGNDQAMLRRDDAKYRHRSRTGNDPWDYRFVFALMFAVMFVSTVLARLSPSNWGAWSSHQSVFKEAVARTDTIVPFLFMG